MLSSADVAPYSNAIDHLTTVALGDVRMLLEAVRSENPIETRDLLVANLPDVVIPYADSAAEIAAQFYVELRDLTVPGGFDAVTTGVPDRTRVEALARYALKPLFGQSDSTVLSLLSGGVQRTVANAGRATLFDNGYQDTVKPLWARVPRPGCCSFCGLLATRGAAYSSEESATGVVGRGVDPEVTRGKRGGQGRGAGRTRGSQTVGSSYHDHCRCVPMPLHNGQSMQLPADVQKFEDAYNDKQVLTDGAVDLKKTLAVMRAELGTR